MYPIRFRSVEINMTNVNLLCPCRILTLALDSLCSLFKVVVDLSLMIQLALLGVNVRPDFGRAFIVLLSQCVL